jgi:rod shape determining protein RodA
MTVGLVPVIGLPLPLLSYGGTSVVATLVMIGLLHSVHRTAR